MSTVYVASSADVPDALHCFYPVQIWYQYPTLRRLRKKGDSDRRHGKPRICTSSLSRMRSEAQCRTFTAAEYDELRFEEDVPKHLQVANRRLDTRVAS